MAIRYEIKAAGELLTVVASGSDENLQDVQNYGLAIIESAVRHGCKTILCNELELEYRLNYIDTYQAAAFIAEHAPRVGKVAIACQPKFIRDAQFWENVAVNRGLSVRVFQDLDAATQWLGPGLS